ncbi:MAG: exonuclease SbcCD subunit D [bacterium]|nr:exonuclease SbcCD subunit D [bacterium]
MRLLHLSDLHIGKRVYEFSMIEDQKYILRQIAKIAVREKVGAVLLAGDVYDKPLPPAEAVLVFDAFLTELAKQETPVCIISGNHDSAERLSFGAQLMEGRDIYFSPVYDGTVKKVYLKDIYGTVVIHLLPFLKPATVRQALQRKGCEVEIRSYQDALREAVSKIEYNPAERNILLAHQFVTGASRCESEEIMVGGLDNVEVSVFDGFDYVALGHIHSPQHVGRDTVRYCGTPLKYSFSEANQVKTVTIVEMKEKGRVEIQEISLSPLRDLRKIRGTYQEVTARSFYQGMHVEDYLHVTLTDEEDVLDAMQKLRLIYPNLMRLEYDNQRTRENQMVNRVEDVEKKTPQELFEEFFELQNNRPMSDEQKKFVHKMMQEIVGNF